VSNGIPRNAKCPCGNGRKYKLCCGKTSSSAPIVHELLKKSYPGPGLMVLMPTRGAVAVETVSCLMNPASWDGVRYIVQAQARLGVAEARNTLARNALLGCADAPWTPDEWFVLWIDDDSHWEPGTIRTALEILRKTPQVDILAGWFCVRNEFNGPAAFTRITDDRSRPVPANPTRPELFEVEAVGFHWVMHRLSVLERVGPRPFECIDGTSEDFSFCSRARRAGLRTFTTNTLPIAHIEALAGFAYLPYMPKLRALVTRVVSLDGERSYGSDVDTARARY
jgi:GT2 family glycosyltransferase